MTPCLKDDYGPVVWAWCLHQQQRKGKRKIAFYFFPCYSPFRMIHFGILKYISVFLLSVFVFSCAGAGLGMTAHATFFGQQTGSPMSSLDKQISEHQHGCCGVASAESGNNRMASALPHHQITKYMFEQIFFFIFAALVFLSWFFHSCAPDRFYHYYRQYLQRWRESWQYFSLYFVRLFSQGILHSKAW